MNRQLPPLNWLRAFEASARYQNFTRAADELGVTQAAVSQHVKALESRLGVTLFHRGPRGLSLSTAGSTYLPKLSAALDLMEVATRDVSGYRSEGSLTVRVPSSFSIQWLVPRLNRFHSLHPSIDIRITALEQYADFGSEQVDVDIRYGDGNWPGAQANYLLGETIFPVCSPTLINSEPALRAPEDLINHTLLHVNGYPEDWPMWLALAGVELSDSRRGLKFDQSIMTLQAALNGLGVALGRSPIVQRELDAGRLIAPFDLALEGRGGYWIVSPDKDTTNPRICAFRQWLKLESASFEGDSATKIS